MVLPPTLLSLDTIIFFSCPVNLKEQKCELYYHTRVDTYIFFSQMHSGLQLIVWIKEEGTDFYKYTCPLFFAAITWYGIYILFTKKIGGVPFISNRRDASVVRYFFFQRVHDLLSSNDGQDRTLKCRIYLSQNPGTKQSKLVPFKNLFSSSNTIITQSTYCRC